MTMMECSIVIRAYNEARHIGRLLEGIQQQTVRDVEVILVDSGSQDGTPEIAARFPGVRLVRIQPEEFTFGRSLNRGLMQATRDLVVIASAHVYPVYPDWLEKLLEPFTDPKVGLSYGKQRGADSSWFSEHQVFAHWFPDVSQPEQPHPFCNNANAWARWASEHGQAISYMADAEIIHVHQETARGIYNRYRREGMAFKQIYPQEQFHLNDLVRLFVGNVSSDMRQAAGQKRFLQAWRGILLFRWAQFYGTYQGYRRSGPLTWQLKQAFYYPNQAVSGQSKPKRDVPPIQYGGPGHL
jgi:glycosyltransferase involved in cell wall biosynthesis